MPERTVTDILALCDRDKVSRNDLEKLAKAVMETVLSMNDTDLVSWLAMNKAGHEAVAAALGNPGKTAEHKLERLCQARDTLSDMAAMAADKAVALASSGALPDDSPAGRTRTLVLCLAATEEVVDRLKSGLDPKDKRHVLNLARF